MGTVESLNSEIAEIWTMMAKITVKLQAFQKALAGAEPLYRDAKAQILSLKEAPIAPLAEYSVVASFYKLIRKRRREIQIGAAQCSAALSQLQKAYEQKQAAVQQALDAVQCVPNNIVEFRPCQKTKRSE